MAPFENILLAAVAALWWLRPAAIQLGLPLVFLPAIISILAASEIDGGEGVCSSHLFEQSPLDDSIRTSAATFTDAPEKANQGAHGDVSAW